MKQVEKYKFSYILLLVLVLFLCNNASAQFNSILPPSSKMQKKAQSVYESMKAGSSTIYVYESGMIGKNYGLFDFNVNLPTNQVVFVLVFVEGRDNTSPNFSFGEKGSLIVPWLNFFKLFDTNADGYQVFSGKLEDIESGFHEYALKHSENKDRQAIIIIYSEE